MPLVSDLISHILLHVNAEAADSDLSQVAGVQDRAQLVRDAVQGLRTNSRDLTLRDILQAIFDAIPTSTERDAFRRAIVNMRDSGERRVQLAIQNWVGKAEEVR